MPGLDSILSYISRVKERKYTSRLGMNQRHEKRLPKSSGNSRGRRRGVYRRVRRAVNGGVGRVRGVRRGNVGVKAGRVKELSPR